MTHYNVNYSHLEEPNRSDKAIADLVEWLGEDRFTKLTEDFRKLKPMDHEQFAMWLSIAGVQGFPVIAYWRHIWGEKNVE